MMHGPETEAQAENSEVLPFVSVAVAVNTDPPMSGRVTEKPALPLASVITFVEPRNICPSPLPPLSHERLLKNSKRYSLLLTLFNVPDSVTFPLATETPVMTGTLSVTKR